MDFKNVATMLGGFGAGYSGQGGQYLAGLEAQKQTQMIEAQRQQQLSEERKKAMIQDAYGMLGLLEQGKVEPAVRLGNNRLEVIKQLGGDPSDTQEIMGMITSGDPAQFAKAKEELRTLVDAGIAGGYLQLPEQAQMNPYQKANIALKERELEWKMKNPAAGASGQTPASIQEIAYYNSLPEGAEKEAVGRKIGMISKEGAVLSPYAEKQIDMSGADAARLGSEASMYDSIATDLEQRAKDMPSGKLSAINEMIKSFTGSEDDITSLRKKALQVVNTEAIKNLPAGSATEKDVEMAVAPLPSQNADPIYIAKWLKSIANLNRKASEFAEFKANFIAGNGNFRTKSGESLIAAWKRQQEEGMRSAPTGATQGIAPASATGEPSLEDLLSKY